MILKNNNITLRAIEESDIEFIRDLVNDPVMESTIVGWAYPISQRDQENWFRNFSNSDKMIRYIIETNDGERIGLTGLRNIDWKNGTIQDGGIRIIKKNQSKGIGSQCFRLMQKYVFEELRLHRYTISAFDDNIPSIKCIEKAGFIREGIEREAIFKGGKYKNVITFSILSTDYFNGNSK